jgi:catechol 2,3-dioxygenase-like lactoylglutathione lyase family enzyme
MRLESVVINCRDKHALAAFWCAVLGTTVRGEVGQYLGLHPTQQGTARLLFQQVDDLPPSGHVGRVHIDVESHDVDADTRRVVDLGATLEGTTEEFGIRWSTLRDPEGNVFCVVPAG